MEKALDRDHVSRDQRIFTLRRDGHCAQAPHCRLAQAYKAAGFRPSMVADTT
jgi:hypothetical protein